MRNLMVTGGAGFIGSNFVTYLLERYADYRVVVYDKLTYAGNLNNLRHHKDDPRYTFVQGDICDQACVREAVQANQVDTIVNFAAETHVDRSLTDAGSFINTDVYGTFVLLETAREFKLERYHQVSTDEVYGEILQGSATEDYPICTRSPYSASKAGGDLMVLAYYTSFGLPVTITRGSNNIGPFQYPEKVVPLFVTNAIDDKPLPIYGDGLQMRDYQFVEDHCEGIDLVLHQGQLGEVYNLGTGAETRNIEMANLILELLEKPRSLLQYITDRPGHDRRYSLDVSKINALGWHSRHDFNQAIEATVRWYRDNEWWWREIKSGARYQAYYQGHYTGREVGAPKPVK
ncbi:MAG: dTDP-glucose 4,6-dehydratase [Anaerolineae bacterium]